MKHNKPEMASILNTYRLNTFFSMTLLMGSMSCQNSLKMHFWSCDSGMSLILEVDVAAAFETIIWWPIVIIAKPAGDASLI